MNRKPQQQEQAPQTRKLECRAVGRHQIVYDGGVEEDVTVVMMAMAGLTTAAIAQATGLTMSQVQYRISKAQWAEGVAVGYRAQWRAGTSSLFQRFQKTVAPSLRRHVQQELPKFFAKPAMEVSPKQLT